MIKLVNETHHVILLKWHLVDFNSNDTASYHFNSESWAKDLRSTTSMDEVLVAIGAFVLAYDIYFILNILHDNKKT